MSIWDIVLLYSAAEITGIVVAVKVALVAIIGAVGAAVNQSRARNCDNPKCCFTGKDLKKKPKKNKKSKKASSNEKSKK